MSVKNLGLEGKIAVIAGGGGEIGSALAGGYADAGCKVAILDKKADIVERPQLRNVTGFLVDLVDVEGIKTCIRSVIGAYGGIDILVHAAGINFHLDFFSVGEKQWDETISVNLKSAFFLAQLAAESMKERGGGKIVFISSISAKIGYPGLNEYTASKGGMEALVRNLSTELAPYNICVNALAPGTTKTRMTEGLWKNDEKKRAHEATIPMNRMAVPRDHVGPALFLSSAWADYVTGAVLPSDGGLTAMQADFIDLRLRGE